MKVIKIVLIFGVFLVCFTSIPFVNAQSINEIVNQSLEQAQDLSLIHI